MPCAMIAAPTLAWIGRLAANDAPHPRRRKSTVWEWTGAGLDQGDDAAQWFSKYLGFPVRLVRYIGSGSAAAAQKVRRRASRHRQHHACPSCALAPRSAQRPGSRAWATCMPLSCQHGQPPCTGSGAACRQPKGWACPWCARRRRSLRSTMRSASATASRCCWRTRWAGGRG